MLPLNNLILIRPLKKEAEKKTEGGLIMLEGAEPTEKGEIVKVSPEITAAIQSLGLPISEGTTVLYPVGAGTRVKDGTTELILIDYSRLMAIL